MNTTPTLAPYEPCDQCEAPLDAQQRFCIVCGANRRHPDDPVARYLSNVRKPAPVVEVSSSSSRFGDPRVLLVALALLPVAAAAGVLVAKGDNKADPNLIAALNAQQKALQGAPAAAGATTPVSNVNTGQALTSDFSLDKGFVVQLSTLPFKTTDKAAGEQAVSGAEGDGAKDVGIINPDDFTLKPASGGDYIVYSGEFKTKADATKALAKLKKDFPDAKVVEVKPLSGAGVKGPAGSIDADAEYQATPTQEQEDEGAQIVQEIQDKVGEDYVDQQRELPDTIVVP